ncbi:MAG: hypothetical protein NTW86_06665 [Candidatus Sumerlaeota bacterium]|nr:hypothetical protein [Candidatus Sumerlaeota bacterium]
MSDVVKSRTRGLEELELRLGDVTAEIRRRARRVRPLRVFEIGFGHGVAMMEILRRLGEQFDFLRKREVPPRPALRVWLDQWLGRQPLTVNRQPYLEMRKTARFDLKLDLARVIDLNTKRADWYGFQSYYRTRD